MGCRAIVEVNNIKAAAVTGREDLHGCGILRILHCTDTRLTDGDEVVGLKRPPRSTPNKLSSSVLGIRFY
jgi:hypothetical protein